MINRLSRVWLSLCLSLSAVWAFAGVPVKVACVGNSVTYGMGVDDREHNCYPARLAQLLGDGYEVRNFGKSGATLLAKGHRPYVEQQAFADAVAFAGDVVVIHLGLNDTDPRNWPNYKDDFVHDYLRLIDTFKSVNPKCRVIICRMTPITSAHWRFKSGTRDWYAQIQSKIEHVAQLAGVELIDLQELLYDRPQLLPDALHPNVEGAYILARRVYAAITGDYGGLSMAPIYGDSMVLQCDKVLTISGMANAGETVEVKIAGQKRKTVASCDGHWQVELGPLRAGGPHKMSVKAASGSLLFDDVMAGQVWLCSGQSNMAFKVRQAAGAEEAMAGAEAHAVRLYNMQPRVCTDAVSWDSMQLALLNNGDYYLDTRWQRADAQSVGDFSAVAYYFGKMLADSLGVPVGLICNAVGGAPAEAFIGRSTMEFNPVLVDELGDWKKSDMLQGWVRERAALNIKNTPFKSQRHPYEPCYLYMTGIAPLSAFPVSGFIWYQGESNAHNAELHEVAFPALIESWRKTWGETLPFYYVQLSSMERPSWPYFRDSQRRMSYELDNVAMVVSSDLGDRYDVHPVHKRQIGERLALQALHRDYGMSHVVPCGPMFRRVCYSGGSAYVEFDYADGMTTSDGEALRSFEVAGDDGLFVAAEAVVEGDKVKVSSAKVKSPRYVRYGWQPFSTGNLVNGAGLPASTFTSGN